MRLNEYQERATRFAKYGDDKMYPWLAIGEESGEILGKIAKFSRKFQTPQFGTDLETTEGKVLVGDLVKELGDLLWQVQESAGTIGFTLEEIAAHNLSKLEGREARGTIVGSGDNR